MLAGRGNRRHRNKRQAVSANCSTSGRKPAKGKGNVVRRRKPGSKARSARVPSNKRQAEFANYSTSGKKPNRKILMTTRVAVDGIGTKRLRRPAIGIIRRNAGARRPYFTAFRLGFGRSLAPGEKALEGAAEGLKAAAEAGAA